MSLIPDTSRNEKDIDEIFSHIYSDLISIHPSNEPFRIFLQYFQPLFDLTLGISFTERDFVATSCLVPSQKQILQRFATSTNKTSITWSNCEECKTESCRELKNNIFHIKDAKSCLIIPIKVEGCISEINGTHNYYSEKLIGSFYLFSRLPEQSNTLDYITRHVAASFLEQSARGIFLSAEKCGRCSGKPICNKNGIGLLNKVGKKLWK
ncbi:MAG: hypothetical protein H8D45_14435 [Bacteroidetes bacterium]|nr:hypothetical protein [Bacteroidota bacterium]